MIRARAGRRLASVLFGDPDRKRKLERARVQLAKSRDRLRSAAALLAKEAHVLERQESGAPISRPPLREHLILAEHAAVVVELGALLDALGEIL